MRQKLWGPSLPRPCPGPGKSSHNVLTHPVFHKVCKNKIFNLSWSIPPSLSTLNFPPFHFPSHRVVLEWPQVFGDAIKGKLVIDVVWIYLGTYFHISQSHLYMVQPSLCREGFQDIPTAHCASPKQHGMKTPGQRLFQEMERPQCTWHCKDKDKEGKTRTEIHATRRQSGKFF